MILGQIYADLFTISICKGKKKGGGGEKREKSECGFNPPVQQGIFLHESSSVKRLISFL